ncbi:hypothetical protein [Trichormus sp. NMC-1]|uniref:hypothetical protein n=1 Tax=Trichormus sp. NMC-1 TaxID=1853259 RepID=UPI0008DC02EE|nr:hypothetical protein [Trichormus sp. NMC-1]
MKRFIMPLVISAAAVGGAMTCLSPANAVVVTLNNTQYNVTTVGGTFNSNQIALELNPWWGQSDVAQSFANQVQTPELRFAWTRLDIGMFGSVSSRVFGVGEEVIDTRVIPAQWAVATELPQAEVPFDNIPGGATIPTVGGLFALGLMRKAKKSIASKSRLANPVTGTVS